MVIASFIIAAIVPNTFSSWPIMAWLGLVSISYFSYRFSYCSGCFYLIKTNFCWCTC